MSMEIVCRCEFCGKEVFTPVKARRSVAPEGMVSPGRGDEVMLPPEWRRITQHNSLGSQVWMGIFCSQRCIGGWYVRDSEAAEVVTNAKV